MSYDISISLLKKIILEIRFCKLSLGKGELIHFPKASVGQSNMTTSILRQYPPSTLNHHRATAVPSEWLAVEALVSNGRAPVGFSEREREW
jgi:hypothetical protein